MKTLFDLPAHIFFIHVPVVLTPLVCAAAIALALRPAWRRKYRLMLIGSTAVIFVSILLAAWSGEPLDEIIGQFAPTDKHKSLGETTRLFAAGLFASSVALVGFPWWRERQGDIDADGATAVDSTTKTIVAVLAAATIGFAVLSTVWVIRTGHEGARITWTGTFPDEG